MDDEPLVISIIVMLIELFTAEKTAETPKSNEKSKSYNSEVTLFIS